MPVVPLVGPASQPGDVNKPGPWPFRRQWHCRFRRPTALSIEPAMTTITRAREDKLGLKAGVAVKDVELENELELWKALRSPVSGSFVVEAKTNILQWLGRRLT